MGHDLGRPVPRCVGRLGAGLAMLDQICGALVGDFYIQLNAAANII